MEENENKFFFKGKYYSREKDFRDHFQKVFDDWQRRLESEERTEFIDELMNEMKVFLDELMKEMEDDE